VLCTGTGLPGLWTTFVPPEYTNLFPAKIDVESVFFGEDGLTVPESGEYALAGCR